MQSKKEIAAYNSGWFQNNKTHRRLYLRLWRKRNPTKAAAYNTKYNPRRAGSCVRKVYRAYATAIQYGLTEHFTVKDFRMLCRKVGYICVCCRHHFKVVDLTPDHVVPMSRGGSNTIDNIQPLCIDCNQTKSTKIIDYRK